jgi:hypothetical protein
MGIVHPGVPQRLALWLRDEAAAKEFIETGTYLADTALWAARHFERVISIEADRKLYDAARRRLASYPNVDLRFGRSQDVLMPLISSLRQPVLIWLDAHLSCGEVATAGEDHECPLLEEITAIDAGKVQHLILIDDARFFLNPPLPPHKREHWPSAGTVIEHLRAKYDSYICVTDDVIVRLPIDLRGRFEAFMSHRPPTGLRTILRQVLAPGRKIMNSVGWSRRCWATGVCIAKDVIKCRRIRLASVSPEPFSNHLFAVPGQH